MEEKDGNALALSHQRRWNVAVYVRGHPEAMGIEGAHSPALPQQWVEALTKSDI